MKRKSTKRIVVHHTAGHLTDTLEDVRRWHAEKGFTDAAGHCGYHYFIDGAGMLHPDRPDDEWGCAVKNANENSVSICLAGNFDRDYPTQAQITTLIGILIKMVVKYHLRYWNIYAHRDIKYLFIFNTTQTNCCGNHLITQLPDIRKRVAMATEIKK
jgi:N-acetylmuramoyl-L-alanine amidase